MRRAILNKYIDLLGQADVLHAIRESPGRHVAFLGAGLSKEAKVPLANEICEDIRRRLLNGREDIADTDTWARDVLAWDKPGRYMACLNAYGSAADRVSYFRDLLRGARPAFAHHAVALLMTRGLLFETALTTNFDKLVEGAFLEQGRLECQAIRTGEEAAYWLEESEKCYLFKLHGDYDTHNILNTQPETRSIAPFFLDNALQFLRGRGLLVLGSAGNEESIVEFIKRLTASDDRQVLARGLRWGVFVGSRRPENLAPSEELNQLQAAIERGAVSQQIAHLLGDMHDKFGDRRPCSFFPIWGSGNLLLSLIDSAGRPELAQAAQLLLDHNMRLHATFRAQHLNPEAIEAHIAKMEAALQKIGRDGGAPDLPARIAFHATSSASPTTVRIAYGDLTSFATLADSEFREVRRAVVSSEDVTISAGGGVALPLLIKAGARQLLNELSKLSPIPQGTCAVTSAGNLPVHYVLHAAAMRIRQDGSYDINVDHVRSATADALRLAEALQVGAIWIPLLGTGVGDVPRPDALAGILESVANSQTALPKRCVTIVIFQESVLSRDDVRAAVKRTLPNHTLTES